MEDRLLTCEELADVLKLRPGTIRKLTYQRRIPAVRIGKRSIRYRLREVERVLVQDQPARA